MKLEWGYATLRVRITKVLIRRGKNNGLMTINLCHWVFFFFFNSEFRREMLGFFRAD